MSSMSTATDFPLSRLLTQSRVCNAVVIDTVHQTLLDGKPADRCLKDAFYLNRQLGARDRRLINETLYALLRWWGWLYRLAPTTFIQAWKTGKSLSWRADNAAWQPCLAAAWLLEPRLELPPAVRYWLDELGWNDEQSQNLPADATLAERAALLAALCPEVFPTAPEPHELIPDWTSGALGLIATSISTN